MKKLFAILSSLALLFTFAAGASAAAPAFQVEPFTFLASGEMCDLAAQWMNGEGLPDNGFSTNYALYLQKHCATSEVAAAGADIVSPLEGGPVSALTELNFDYRNDGHCGAGAPRFNVQVNGSTYFLGCTQGTHTPIAGTNWTHVEFGPADFALAGIPTTGTLEDIYIIFDEGTDTPTGGTIAEAGHVFIDNISVNNQEVGRPGNAQTKDECKNGGWMAFGTYKNQGQCVSAVARSK